MQPLLLPRSGVNQPGCCRAEHTGHEHRYIHLFIKISNFTSSLSCPIVPVASNIDIVEELYQSDDSLHHNICSLWWNNEVKKRIKSLFTASLSLGVVPYRYFVQPLIQDRDWNSAQIILIHANTQQGDKNLKLTCFIVSGLFYSSETLEKMQPYKGKRGVSRQTDCTSKHSPLLFSPLLSSQSCWTNVTCNQILPESSGTDTTWTLQWDS